MSKNGHLYHILKTHKQVEEFCFELHQAVDFPTISHPALVSIGQWYKDGKILSMKQIKYAIILIQKQHERN